MVSPQKSIARRSVPDAPIKESCANRSGIAGDHPKKAEDKNVEIH